jgi:outer membrane protein assembly factor BamB
VGGGEDDHKLSAFNAANGALIWSATTVGQIFSSPAVANGVVYVGSNDDKLNAFNAANGALIWSAPTGAAVSSSPAVANGIVYVGGGDDKLYPHLERARRR